jgi:hypothetical protein
MTGENIQDFIGQGDENKPMSKWLKKRGYSFDTGYTGIDPKDKVMFSAVIC